MQAKDSPAFRAYAWPTYAERLQQAGVSWRVYQEYDNYGDNALGLLRQLPRPGSGLAAAPAGPRLGRRLERRQRQGPLTATPWWRPSPATSPRTLCLQVSWIVAPSFLSEHPAFTPDAGANLTARLIAALTANPAVWAKTAFILNYDENDGFFDHMPPLVPPTGGAPGASTVSAGRRTLSTACPSASAPACR